jgi:effector-binding domain-containing protein
MESLMFIANPLNPAGLFAVAAGLISIVTLPVWAASQPPAMTIAAAGHISKARTGAEIAQSAPDPSAPSATPTPDPNKPSGDASTGFGLTVAAKPVVLVQGASTWDEGYQHITDAFKTLQTEATKAGLKTAGRPMTVFVETDDMGFRYQAMLPIETAPEGKDTLTPDVKIGKSPAGKALKFQHRGAYDDIDSTYEAITAYLDEKGLEAQNLFIEEYLNDVKGSDDTGLEVDIYVFVK